MTPGLLTPSIGAIVTKSGSLILVDAADFDEMSLISWRTERTLHKFYTIADVGDKTVYMHRMLIGLEFGDERMGDHKNGCTVDNRRENLRIVNSQQNVWTGDRSRRNKTGFVGVTFVKQSGKYEARIYVKGVRVRLGYFDTAAEAAAIYAKRYAEVEFEVIRSLTT